MNAGGRRRKGIVSLPVAIFFVALVAAAAVSAGEIASGQTALANKQLSSEGILAARQAQLSGLSAISSGNGTLRLALSSGTATSINYALIQTSAGQTAVEPVDYVINPGNTITINLTSMAQSAFGKSLPSIASITLVTGQGVYITSRVQTVQQSRQIITYQQRQVQKTAQQLVGYDVSMTSAAYYSCNGVVSDSSLCNTSYSAAQQTQYSCASGETLINRYGNWICQGTAIGFYWPTVTTTPGYYTCPSGWSLGGSTCSQQQTFQQWYPGHYTYQTVQNYHPGYWSTQQVWNPGYWTSYYVPGYYTTQSGWCAMLIFCSPPPGASITCGSIYLIFADCTWTLSVYHPGYWTSVYHPGYWTIQQVWHPGYWTTEWVRVWNPGYWSTVSRYVSQPATWNPPVTTYSCTGYGATLQNGQFGLGCYYTSTYTSTPLVYFTYSCSSGDTLSGTTCKHSYPAVYFPAKTTSLGQLSYCPSGSQYACKPVYNLYTYTVTETVPVTTTVSYETLSTQGSTWLIGG